MRKTIFVLICIVALARVAAATPFAIYSNLAVNGQMAAAGRTNVNGLVEIEPADDFIINSSAALVTEVKFIGLLTNGATLTDVNDINLEFYRVFPKDSDTVRTPQVPTRANSPSDVAFDERSGFAALTSLTATLIAPGVTEANSVKNGIFPKPNQQTLGEGPVTGTEFLFDAVFATPVLLPLDHYFFVPQVSLSRGGSDFFWVSASRNPIAPPGTPINPDLQAWIRNGFLDPDWLRIGTDIVGGATPPTFNMAFEIDGEALPEPATLLLFGTGIAALARRAGKTR
jgi:hypothetical protein